MPPLWRRSLEVLRRQFEDASFRYPSLHCMLSEASADEEGERLLHEGPPLGMWRGNSPVLRDEHTIGRPPGFRATTPEESAAADPDDDSYLRENPDNTGRAVGVRDAGTSIAGYYWGRDEMGLSLFHDLAVGMGRLLPSIPRDYTRLIPPEVIWHSQGVRKIGKWELVSPAMPVLPGREDSRWMQAVFNIAWLSLPASPLRASRRTWIRNHVYPYDDPERRILLESLPPGEKEKLKTPPKHYFSVLPFGVFLSSVFAIDAMLDVEASTQLEPGNLLVWAGDEAAHLALVFTDLKGGTALRKQLGEDAMGELIHAHYARAKTRIRENGGRLVKTTGDGVIAVFRNAGAALNFCLAFSGDTGDPRLRIRASVHVDQVLIADNDIEGQSVAYAARMLEASKAADVRVSSAARKAVLDRKAAEHEGLIWSEMTTTLKDFGPDEKLWIVSPPPRPTGPPANETAGGPR